MDNYSSARNRNNMVKQYEPLMNKITAQFVNKINVEWSIVKSMAYEGFAIAMNTYDAERSKMSFQQYAGYSIRNSICSGLDNELRTVKMSHYAQLKAQESGDAVFNTVSIDVRTCETADCRTPQEINTNMYENEKFSDGDPLEYLCSRLEDEFDSRDCQMFFMTFGLRNEEETKGKDIAKYFGISEGRVSQLVKKMLKFIRKDTELCEVLANMME